MTHFRPKPMISRPRIVCLMVTAFLLLAGCGQSGPLFLPEDAPPPAEPAANANGTTNATASDPASNENKADDEER